MTIPHLLRQKNTTMYALSKKSGVPYATLNDICSGKTRLDRCAADTVYKLSKELEVSMEDLLAPCYENRLSFDLFKSNVCHRLKELGDIDFIIETLEKKDIRAYYERKWYPESLYLLAMLDYLSRINSIPLALEYNDIRSFKLRDRLYPASVLAAATVARSEQVKEQAARESIPEFIRFNIVESEVRNLA